MVHKKWSLKEAYNHALNCREVIDPNNGFWSQLLVYENELYGKVSMTTKGPTGQPPTPLNEKKEEQNNKKSSSSQKPGTSKSRNCTIQ